MVSVKMDDDVDAQVTALRGHVGKTKSDVIRYLIRHYQEGATAVLKAVEQLGRIEAGVVRLEMKLEEKQAAPRAYQVE